MFDGTTVNIAIAFGAGIITFFASCLLPLVPVYIAYLSGVSIYSLKKGRYSRFLIVKTSTFFVFGFITVFIVLGAALNSFSRFLGPYRLWMERSAGILFILLGFFMLGIFKSRLLSSEYRIDIHNWFKKNKLLHALVTGIAFAFGWTPCVGPVLSVILYWSSQQESMIKGYVLLTSYGLGIGIPFLMVGLLFDRLMPLLKRFQRLTNILNKVAAIVIIGAGILLFVGKFRELSFYLLDLFGLNRLAV